MATYAPFADKPHRTLFIPDPRLPASAMKTYGLIQPRHTHFRRATCEEYGCEKYLKGWVTRLPWGSDLVEVLRKSGRTFTETTEVGAAEREFMFAPGQPCFKSSTHKVRNDRPPLYVIRDGDWRGNPRGTAARSLGPDDWVDDFANHQITLSERLARG